MPQTSKQFAESVTDSKHKVFLWARLKLTGVYVLIVAVIIFGFSLALYQNLSRNLSDASEDDFVGAESHHHFVQTTLDNVSHEIMLIDFIVLIAAAGASYFLAGYTLRPIQRSMEAQKKFSENASHELRTPLAVMRNDMEVLRRNPHPDKEQIHEVLTSNIEEIDRMTEMTEDLLLLARSENKHLASLHKTDLAMIAKTTAEKMRTIVYSKGINLGISSKERLPILGNTLALERIFTNIIKNSIEHTPKGCSIEVNAFRDNSNAVTTVTDTGSGISEKDLPHIFERFYKSDGGSGTGLGLSIVKELVNQNNGTIHITSTKGKGTTVRIEMPVS